MKRSTIFLGLPLIITTSLYSMEQSANVVPQLAGAPLRFEWGVADRRGKRSAMEDAHVVCTSLTEHKEDGFFAVYDGHTGTIAADYLACFFHKDLTPSFDHTDATANHYAFKELFHRMDSEFLAIDESGSTAAMSYLQKDTAGNYKAYFVWVGDTRIMHCDAAADRIKFVSVDHKPDTPEEKQRIIDNGAIVSHCHGCWRVNGSLAMSRSFGDADIKRRHPGTVVVDPSFHEAQIAHGDIIIIACDGFWDVISNERACQMVKDFLYQSAHLEEEFEHRYSLPPDGERSFIDGNAHELKTISQLLRDYAYACGSSDNITVMVVRVVLK